MRKLLLGNADHNNSNSNLQNIVLDSIFDILNLKLSEVQFIPIKSYWSKADFSLRDAPQSCSAEQGVGGIKINPRLTLIKDQILDKLHEMDLQKFKGDTKLYIDDIPISIRIDVDSPYISQCGNYGHIQVGKVDRISAMYRSSVNQAKICSLNPYEKKDTTHFEIGVYVPEVTTLLPVSCDKDFNSSNFIIPQDDKNVICICSSTDQSERKSVNQSELKTLERQLNSMKIISARCGFSSNDILPNIQRQHEDSTRSFNYPVYEALMTNGKKKSSNTSDDIRKYHQYSSMNLDTFAKGNHSKLSKSSTAYLMKLEYPCSFLIYSLFNQNHGMQTKQNKCLETGSEKSNRKLSNLKCKCREKSTRCTCQPQREETTKVNEFKSLRDSKTCGCSKVNEITPYDKTVVRKVSKVYQMRKIKADVCDKTIFMQNEFFSHHNETSNMQLPALSPIRINDFEMTKDHKKYSLIKSEDAAGIEQKLLSYSKHHTGRRVGSKIQNSNKSKRMCGCTKPYEPKTPLSLPSEKYHKQNGQCLPIPIHQVFPPAKTQQKNSYSCSCRDSSKVTDLIGEQDKSYCRTHSKALKTQQKNETDGNKPHFCDICKFINGLGDILDEKKSLLTIEFSDVDQFRSLLNNVNKNKSKISTTKKCLNETDGNIDSTIFDEYLLTCSTETSNELNTREFNFEQSDKNWCSIRQKNSDTCECIEASSKESFTKTDIECIFKRELPCDNCSLYEPVHSSETDGLCGYDESYKPEMNEKRDVNVEKSKDTENNKFSAERGIDRGQEMPLIDVELDIDVDRKDDVECIFKRKTTFSSSGKPETNISAQNIETSSIEEEDEPMQNRSCYKETCVRLMEPLITPKKILTGCVVRGTCIREKLLQTICVPPEVEQKEEIQPKKTDPGKRTSVKIVDKKLPKSPAKETKSSNKKSSKVPLKKAKSKQASSVVPSKTQMKQTNSKQPLSESATKVPLKKTNSKQVSSVGDTKVPPRKTNSKQAPSVKAAKVPLRKTNSKQVSSVSDTKVPPRKTNSKQVSSGSDTKVPPRKTNSKQVSSRSATKVPPRQTNKKQAPSILKQTETKQVPPELPELRLNDIDKNLLSHALEVYLKKQTF